MQKNYFLVSNVSDKAREVIEHLQHFTPEQYKMYKSAEAKLDIEDYESVTLEETKLLTDLLHRSSDVDNFDVIEVDAQPDLVEFDF